LNLLQIRLFFAPVKMEYAMLTEKPDQLSSEGRGNYGIAGEDSDIYDAMNDPNAFGEICASDSGFWRFTSEPEIRMTGMRLHSCIEMYCPKNFHAIAQ